MANDIAAKSEASSASEQAPMSIERVQLGVRMEKRMVKVLKAIAEYQDQTLSELLEDMVLHEFEGEGACAFLPQTLEVIKHLKQVYGMDYDVHTNYRFVEKNTKTTS
jgi:hypothetical protein